MEGSPPDWLIGLLADVGSVGESVADCQRKIFRSCDMALNKKSLYYYLECINEAPPGARCTTSGGRIVNCSNKAISFPNRAMRKGNGTGGGT